MTDTVKPDPTTDEPTNGTVEVTCPNCREHTHLNPTDRQFQCGSCRRCYRFRTCTRCHNTQPVGAALGTFSSWDCDLCGARTSIPLSDHTNAASTRDHYDPPPKIVRRGARPAYTPPVPAAMPGAATAPGSAPAGGAPVYTPPAAATAMPGTTNNMAIAAIICAFVFAPLAIVFGVMGRRQIQQNGQEGWGMATWGMILGIIFTAIGAALIIFYIVAIAMLVNSVPSTY